MEVWSPVEELEGYEETRSGKSVGAPNFKTILDPSAPRDNRTEFQRERASPS